MKFLQIGLGSMGKRRIRNLKSLGFNDIIGLDFREDRRKEVTEKYGITTVAELSEEILQERDIYIISTPPDKHNEYLWLAIEYRKPTFVEASVIKQGLEEIKDASDKNNVLIAPSCTLRFHPAIKTIKNIVKSDKYGKICNFIYHMGQYLPDWHPWESIKDFYVSKKETSASREMIPFELTWLTDIVGLPIEAFGFFGKTYEFGVDIDDTYAINLKFKNSFGVLLVDVVSRFATRSLTLNLENAQIRWDWSEKVVKLYDAIDKRWIYYNDPEGTAHAGYNVNIVEEMYVEEINSFIRAVKGEDKFPNTLEEDIKMLDILEKIEKTNRGIEL